MKNLKMKVLGTVTAMLLILSNAAHAQLLAHDNSSRFGIKGGLNISNLYTNDVNSKNTLLGFNGGVFLKIALTDFIAFQPELLYTTKGAELTYNNSFVVGQGRFSLSYLEVPLLAVINITKNVNVHGGVYVASLTDVTIKNLNNNGSYNFEQQLNKDNFETLDYGLTAGVGADFGKTSFGLRYEYGMKTVGKDKSFLGATYRFPDARNSNLSFYISLSIL